MEQDRSRPKPERMAGGGGEEEMETPRCLCGGPGYLGGLESTLLLKGVFF